MFGFYIELVFATKYTANMVWRELHKRIAVQMYQRPITLLRSKGNHQSTADGCVRILLYHFVTPVFKGTVVSFDEGRHCEGRESHASLWILWTQSQRHQRMFFRLLHSASTGLTPRPVSKDFGII